MRLTYSCTACKAQQYFLPKHPSRAALQMQYGDMVKVNCQKCGKTEKKHLNKISAVVDARIIAVGFVLGLIATVLLWNYVGVVASVTLSLPMLVWNHENGKVGHFNRYAIRK
ncbi:hypothetical protein [Maribacter sp. 2-571]|uniref:hypothetical protein n=1 Tax=Maribacter sp. 2-571 TaxID=3417569 RepID=UPI003D359675